MKRGRTEKEEDLFSNWWGDDNNVKPAVDVHTTKLYRLDQDDMHNDDLYNIEQQQQQHKQSQPLPDNDTVDYEYDDENIHDRGYEPEYDEDLHFTAAQQHNKKKQDKDYLSNPLHIGPYEQNKKPWLRPDLVAIDSEKEDFIFQHTETTYGIEETGNRPPVIRIFGVTPNGQSVMFKTRTFRPYFYARIADEREANVIRQRLEDHLSIKTFKRDKVEKYVLSMEPVQRRSMCGWHRNGPLQTMYKITMAHPSHVKTARNALECVNRAVTERYIQTFEGNVPFELRYMVDTGMAGCQWLQLKAGTYAVDPGTASVQYELCPNAGYDHSVINAMPIKDFGDLGPMRYLSFDIEAKRKKPGFCKSEEDPAVLICTGLNVVGKGIIHKAVFALVDRPNQSVQAVEGATVYVFHDEADMLLAFVQYIRESDPDAFTGWNITNFDWPYLCGRAKALGIYDKFMSFSRVIGKKSWLREQVFQSKAYGAKKTNELVCEGRFDYDGLLFMLRGQMTKYRSYKLNAISKEVLNDQKVDVDYTQIPILHEGSDKDRTRLAWY